MNSQKVADDTIRPRRRRPRRLRLAHDLTHVQILERLLALNLERAAVPADR